MKKRILIAVGFLIIIASLYVIYRDNLPPRTPIKVARLISGLLIPRNAKVVDFKEQWNDFNGNGYSFIIISLDDESFNKIYQEAKQINYGKLPITKNIYGPLKDISEKKAKGIYKVKIDNEASMSFKATMLSEDDNNVIVYFAVN